MFQWSSNQTGIQIRNQFKLHAWICMETSKTVDIIHRTSFYLHTRQRLSIMEPSIDTSHWCSNTNGINGAHNSNCMHHTWIMLPFPLHIYSLSSRSLFPPICKPSSSTIQATSTNNPTLKITLLSAMHFIHICLPIPPGTWASKYLCGAQEASSSALLYETLHAVSSNLILRV